MEPKEYNQYEFAFQYLGKIEQDILREVIKQVQPLNEDSCLYYLSKKKLYELFKNETNKQARLEQAFKNLISTTIVIETQIYTLQAGFLASARYADNADEITVRFAPNLKPFYVMANMAGNTQK